MNTALTVCVHGKGPLAVVAGDEGPEVSLRFAK